MTEYFGLKGDISKEREERKRGYKTTLHSLAEVKARLEGNIRYMGQYVNAERSTRRALNEKIYNLNREITEKKIENESLKKELKQLKDEDMDLSMCLDMVEGVGKEEEEGGSKKEEEEGGSQKEEEEGGSQKEDAGSQKEEEKGGSHKEEEKGGS